MHIILAAVLALLMTAQAHARPMWEVAERWTCISTVRITMHTDGSDFENITENNRLVLDFRAGTAISGFGSASGRIGFTRYSESFWGQFNIVEVMWGTDPYPVIITGENGEWWMTSASGWADPGERMIATTYRCTPG